eukprot:3183692-Pleurochrysis_carterae.AAC.1
MPGVGVRVCAVAYARPIARARGLLSRSRFAPAAGRPFLLSPCGSLPPEARLPPAATSELPPR